MVKHVITLQRAMTEKRSSVFSGKNRVTPSVAAAGDTNPSDATDMFRYVGTKVRNTYKNVNTSLPTWLDDIRCSGSEKHIADCSHSQWGIHNCERSENVAVSCPGKVHTSQLYCLALLVELIVHSRSETVCLWVNLTATRSHCNSAPGSDTSPKFFPMKINPYPNEAPSPSVHVFSRTLPMKISRHFASEKVSYADASLTIMLLNSTERRCTETARCVKK